MNEIFLSGIIERAPPLDQLFGYLNNHKDSRLCGQIHPIEAKNHLPQLESRDEISIAVEDIGPSHVWNMKYRYWPNNKSRMYLLENTGDFVLDNGLQEGNFIVIYADIKCGKYISVMMGGQINSCAMPQASNQGNWVYWPSDAATTPIVVVPQADAPQSFLTGRRASQSQNHQKHGLGEYIIFCQAVAGAQAGASVIQIYVGRLKDWSRNHSGDYEVESTLRRGEDPGCMADGQSDVSLPKNFIHGSGYPNTPTSIECKGCKRLGTVTLISGHGKEFIAEDSKSYLPLMMFDCEGMVPEDYAINGSWKLIIASFIT
ncbi:hypothetical protein T459_11053 [Capsicum annuum]|uniref:TF-B3 domain-containing protein n=1 Tax=Capsicum annuum TaxID=4072 RepID=A0A2G3A3Y1_CAPAN|nr:hypothetical protein T459_11053 [Capsicum annuum]